MEIGGINAADLGLGVGPTTVEQLEPGAPSLVGQVATEAARAELAAANVQRFRIPGVRENHYVLGLIGILVAAGFVQQLNARPSKKKK